MIIRSRAPLRLGIAGGGTDVSPFCDEYGGAVLNATINMYSYCTIIETNDNKIEIHSDDQNQHFTGDSASELTLEDGQLLLFKGVYNHIVKNYLDGKALSFKAYTYSDAPAGSGLGTSSTMVVAILKAFTEWLKLPFGEYDIAQLAFKIEREELGFKGGKQDQYAATFGGFNYMEFYKDRTIVNPLRIKKWILDELESSLVLYFTGVSRDSGKIISEQIKNTQQNNEDVIKSTLKLKDSARKMKEAVLIGDMVSFANELKESWEAKKRTSSIISYPKIEEDYKFIMENGGIAAKVSGAGGGGFMMIICDPIKKYALQSKLKERGGKVFSAKFTKEGTEGWVIYDK